MSYDMKKYHIDDWKAIFARCRANRKKILYYPFYNKRRFVADLYKERFGEDLDFDSPCTFSEKQNVLKLNKNTRKYYSKLTDKHAVRSYVVSKIGPKYLVPEYFYVKKIKLADFKKLPNAFVLKTTNGSGTNYIVLDKKKENLSSVARYINWLSRLKYGYLWGEFFYNKIKRGIIAEKLLLDTNGKIPDDLKCYCFKDDNGKKHKVLYIERVVGDERERIMFDENWHTLNYSMDNMGELKIKPKKPKNYKDILNVIDKLSEDFNFVRVDLYLLGDKIYFGELTFVPTAGYMKFTNDSVDKLWGSWVGNQKEEIL